jgi:hypothetical protein
MHCLGWEARRGSRRESAEIADPQQKFKMGCRRVQHNTTEVLGNGDTASRRSVIDRERPAALHGMHWPSRLLVDSRREPATSRR